MADRVDVGGKDGACEDKKKEVVCGIPSVICVGFLSHHPRVHEIALAATSDPSPKDKSTINVNFRMIVFAVSMSLLSDRWLME